MKYFTRSYIYVLITALVMTCIPFGSGGYSALASTATAVSVTPNVTKQKAAVQITAFVDNSAGSVGVLDVRFDYNVLDIANSAIRVNGQVIGSSGNVVKPNASTLRIPIPATVVLAHSAIAYVQIDIAASDGIINPMAGDYKVHLSTDGGTTWIDSLVYSIVNSIVTNPNTSVSPNVVNQPATYVIQLRTSEFGSLRVGDSIVLDLDNDTQISTTLNSTRLIPRGKIYINGVATTNDASLSSDEQRVLTIRTPVAIPANAEIQVVVAKDAGLINPVNVGSYSLWVHTSADLQPNLSTYYQIDPSVANVKMWLTSGRAGQAGQYLIGLTNGADALVAGDTITVGFPDGTGIPASIAPNHVFLNGTPLTAGVTTHVAQRRVTVSIPAGVTIAANEYASLLLGEKAQITNPKITSPVYSDQTENGKYRLHVSTSKQVGFLPSDPYIIDGSPIQSAVIEMNNLGVRATSEYAIKIKVTNGLLEGDHVYVDFPYSTSNNYTFTTSTNAMHNNIKVNDKSLTRQVTLTTHADLHVQRLAIPIPTEVSIPNGGEINVAIAKTAGIRNPDNPKQVQLSVHTSRDTSAVTYSFWVGNQVSTPEVKLSPNRYQEAGQYIISFTTSNSGQLSGAAAGYIELHFPADTSVPTSAANYRDQVYINGHKAQSFEIYKNAIDQKQILRIYLPSGVTIGQSSPVALTISAQAGIRNPSAGSHQLNIRTSTDNSFIASQSYSTTGSAPTPTNPGSGSGSGNTGGSNLDLSSIEVHGSSSYEMTLYPNTALTGGTDELTVRFDYRVQVPNFIDREMVRINTQPIDVGMVRIKFSDYYTDITFRVPSNLKISANQKVQVDIDQQAGIRHPNTEGVFILYVIPSTSTISFPYVYTTKGQAAYDFYVSPSYNEHDELVLYTMSYTTNVNGGLTGGYDWISLTLPIPLTRHQLLNDIAFAVEGYIIEPNKIQLSNQTVSFFAPDKINIPSKSTVHITIYDEKKLLSYNFYNPYLDSIYFRMMTSRDTTWSDSNTITLLKTTAPTAGSGQTGTTNPTTPKNPTNSQTGNTKIVLTLDKTDASVNGAKQVLEAAPYAIDGTTLVPLRFVTEVLGAEVEYIGSMRMVSVIHGNRYLLFTIGSSEVVTSEGNTKLLQPAQIKNNRTFVPLRFISEWMGIEVEWDGNTRAIILQK